MGRPINTVHNISMSAYSHTDLDNMPTENSPPAKILDAYTIGPPISVGGSSIVWLATHTETRKQFACKCVQLRDGLSINDTRREVQVSRSVSHPAISKITEIFETENSVFMLSEYLPGGDLLDHIAARPDGRLTEQEARPVFRALFSALEALHYKRVAHRDIKPENILFGDRWDLSSASLTDFGLACYSSEYHSDDDVVLDNDPPFVGPCGTPGFVAPEVLTSGRYGCECDLWSIGATIHATLSGRLPFQGESALETLRLTVRGEYSLVSGRVWDECGLSWECKDLLQRLLTKDPRDRLTASSALRHPWLANY